MKPHAASSRIGVGFVLLALLPLAVRAAEAEGEPERGGGAVTLEFFIRAAEGQEERGSASADEVAVGAAAQAAGNQPALPPCPILSAPNVNDLIPGYPRRGRIDYGSAVVMVRFVVDEAGETVDEEVTVVQGRSSAEQPSHFDRFAQAAIKQVQGWTVELPNRDEQSCSMAQSVSITVRFDN